MSLTRYLMYFSYLGKPFHGLQRQMKGGIPRVDDPKTVQGRIEMALKILNPSYDPIIVTSSRTDSGVNALKTTCHVDLSHRKDFAHKPSAITVCLNRYFKKEDVPIRILKTYAVPEDFHCRHHAIYRTYLYRLAIVKADEPSNGNYFHRFFPIEEMQRIRFICTDTFDLDAMKDAANLFVGEHDFRTFMGKGSRNLSMITRRSIEKFDIRNGRCLNYSSSSWPCTSEQYQYLDIYIQAKGFLYRQANLKGLTDERSESSNYNYV